MYNVWIVDDEPLIREGLRTLIRWEAYGFRVGGEFGDGKEAFRRYRDGDRPELMVVDIRMPAMDGLELIEAIRGIDPGSLTRFLILSGYAEFEYARRAIRGRVDGYILKPVEEQELAEMVTLVRIRLDRERLARDRERREWLAFVVSGASAMPDDGELAARGLAWKAYRPVLFEIEVAGGCGTSVAGEPAAAVSALIGEVESNGMGVAFAVGPRWAVLLNESGGPTGGRLSSLRDIVYRIELAHGVRFIAAVGPAARKFADVPAAFARAAALLERRFFLDEDALWGKTPVDVSQAGEDDETWEAALRKAAERLFYAVGLGEKDAVARIVADIAERAARRPNASERSFKADFVRLAGATVARLRKEGSAPDAGHDEWVAEICEQPSMRAVVGHVVGHFAELAGRYESPGAEAVVSKMVSFIQRHYAQPLKLESFSELFHYNAAYLGKLFRRHTGESFHGFLDKVRMERAKELLAQGCKVYEAAERVGYADVDYFHAKFKKYVGVSPSAYRKSATSE